MSNWITVPFLADGTAVAEKITNKPLEAIVNNLNFLYSRLESIEDKRAIIIYDVAAASNVLVGEPVYYNVNTSRVERALSSYSLGDGAWVPNNSSLALGIVSYKSSATLVNIVIYGQVDLAELDSLEDGTYYLSSTTAGGLTNSPITPAVQVLQRVAGKSIVRPQIPAAADRHIHRKFELLCQPAGSHTPPIMGEIHIIEGASDTLPGWLPADHEVFDGNAPAGAKFGYNLSQDSALTAAWNTLVPELVSIHWHKTQGDFVGFTGVPLGANELCVVDRHGIWWMSNCYAEVPWPNGTTFYGTETDTGSETSTTSTDDCYIAQMRMILCTLDHFMIGLSNFLTSLVSEDSRLVITDLGGLPAAAGSLKIDLRLGNAEITPEEAASGFAIKNVTDDGYEVGPVVSGVRSASDTLTITGEDTFTEGGKEYHNNLLVLSVSDPDSRYLVPSELRMNNTAIGHISNPPVFFVQMRPAVDSSCRFVINVPTGTGYESPVLTLRFKLLAQTAGTTPSLTVTQRIIGSSETPAAIPGSDSSVTITTSKVVGTGEYYYTVEATAFAVSDGDTVFVNVSRADDDGYAGFVGIIRMDGVLSE